MTANFDFQYPTESERYSAICAATMNTTPASRGSNGERRRVSDTPSGTLRVSSKRVNSHFNSFQTSCLPSTDKPPTYASVCRHQRPISSHRAGSERLPNYTCTVAVEGKFYLQVESTSPLQDPSSRNPWREVYVVLRGTLLSIHQVKKGPTPGKLIRIYNLQHAEVGLASDTSYAVLVPRTRWARLIPHSARRRAWQKDPNAFIEENQYVLRLRAELDQLILAHSSEEFVYQMISSVGAAIDLAPPLDERSIPRQCTIPRRRRRQQQGQRATEQLNSAALTDPAVVAQQERLLAQMYPDFAASRQRQQLEQQMERMQESGDVVESVDDVALRVFTAGEAINSAPFTEAVESPSTPTIEEDELDLSVMREEVDGAAPAFAPIRSPTAPRTRVQRPATIAISNPAPVRPPISRQTTATSVISVQSTDVSPRHSWAIGTSPPSVRYSAPENFDLQTGKWRPNTTRTAAQIGRYVRRCIPVLLMESARASDVLIGERGRRVRLCPTRGVIEEWSLRPPTYAAHGFVPVEESRISQLAKVEEESTVSSSGGSSSTAANDETESRVDSALGPRPSISSRDVQEIACAMAATANAPQTPDTPDSIDSLAAAASYFANAGGDPDSRTSEEKRRSMIITPTPSSSRPVSGVFEFVARATTATVLKVGPAAAESRRRSALVASSLSSDMTAAGVGRGELDFEMQGMICF